MLRSVASSTRGLGALLATPLHVPCMVALPSYCLPHCSKQVAGLSSSAALDAAVSAVSATSPAPPRIPQVAHTTATMKVNHVLPPSAEAHAAIVEARRDIFGIVEGNNERSGRKVLRQHLRGAAIKSFYPLRVGKDLPMRALGIEEPEVEDRFRREAELQRIGKSLRKGKVRPPTAEFLTRMKLEDTQEEILDQVDYFYPEDALPDEDVIEDLMDGLDTEEKGWMRDIFARMALEVERGRATRQLTATTHVSKDDKKVRARKVAFRQGLGDKKGRGSFTPQAGGEGAAEAAAVDETQDEDSGRRGGDIQLGDDDMKLLAEIRQLLASEGKK